MKIVRPAAIAALTVVCFGAAGMPALAQPLAATYGMSGQDNAAWADLSAPMTFHKGQKLVFHFIGGGPSEMIVRFVPQGCDYNDACSIIEGSDHQCKLWVVKHGMAVVELDRDYRNIIQLSVHSGVGGWAWYCRVGGGAMRQLSSVEID